MYGVEEGPRKGEEDMKRTRAKRQTRKKNRKKRGVRLYTPVKLQVYGPDQGRISRARSSSVAEAQLWRGGSQVQPKGFPEYSKTLLHYTLVSWPRRPHLSRALWVFGGYHGPLLRGVDMGESNDSYTHAATPPFACFCFCSSTALSTCLSLADAL